MVKSTKMYMGCWSLEYKPCVTSSRGCGVSVNDFPSCTRARTVHAAEITARVTRRRSPRGSGLAKLSSHLPDIGLTRRLAIRAVDLDYYLTRFDNGVNQRQNNLKVSAGVIFRF
jgi:hypothetical protein